MSKERVFDPEQIEDYRLFLVELLDTLENRVIPVLSTGALSRMPAGAPGSARLRTMPEAASSASGARRPAPTAPPPSALERQANQDRRDPRRWQGRGGARAAPPRGGATGPRRRP